MLRSSKIGLLGSVFAAGFFANSALPQIPLRQTIGPDMHYGLTTWTQPVPAGGGPMSLFVAGADYANGTGAGDASKSNYRPRAGIA
jgi:hypothetical protein